jgi:hypothetical protein
MNNGHLLQAVAAQAGPRIVIGQQMNDVQLVALIASHMSGLSAAEAVSRAQEIVAEAVATQQRVAQLIQRKVALQQDCE